MEPTNATTVTQEKGKGSRNTIPKLSPKELAGLPGISATAPVMQELGDAYFIEVAIPLESDLGTAKEIADAHHLVTDLQSQASSVGAVTSFNVGKGLANIVMKLPVATKPENRADPLRSAFTALGTFIGSHDLPSLKATWKYRINGTIVFGPTPFQ